MNILVPVLSGSEVRQFFLSSIVSNLMDYGNTIFVIPKFNNSELINELQIIDSRIKIIPHIVQPIDGTKFSYLRLALDEYFDKQNKRWRYSKKNQYKFQKKIIINILILIFHFSFIRKFSLSLEKKWMQKTNVSRLESLLFENEIQKVIVSNARFLYYPELLIACSKLNIPVDVVYHSNKEVFAQPRVNYNYNKFGMWNQEMVDKFLDKYPKNEKKCQVIGNTHFTYFLNNEGIMSYDKFKERFDLQDDSLVILYTAAGIIVENETFIVEWISNFFKKRNKNYKIIVRKNPMDTTNGWDEYFINDADVIIQHPQWIMDGENGINFTKKNDLVEFNSLLTYMSFCINIPSTVTLESAIKKKPVINICFEFPNVTVTTNNKKLSQFWNAPYYAIYHQFDFVLPSFTLTQLEEQLEKSINLVNKYKDYDNCVKTVLGYDLSEINANVEKFILSEN